MTCSFEQFVSGSYSSARPKKNVFIAKANEGPIGMVSSMRTVSNSTNTPPVPSLPRSLGASPIFMSSSGAKKPGDEVAASSRSAMSILDLADKEDRSSFGQHRQLITDSNVASAGADSSVAAATSNDASSIASLDAVPKVDVHGSLLASHLLQQDSHYVSVSTAATQALKSMGVLASQGKSEPLPVTSRKGSSAASTPVAENRNTYSDIFWQFATSAASSSSPDEYRRRSGSTGAIHREEKPSISTSTSQAELRTQEAFETSCGHKQCIARGEKGNSRTEA